MDSLYLFYTLRFTFETVVANKIISLDKRQRFPIVFEVYFLARKGHQSYSHIECLQSVTVKEGILPLYSLDSQNVIFLGQ